MSMDDSWGLCVDIDPFLISSPSPLIKVLSVAGYCCVLKCVEGLFGASCLLHSRSVIKKVINFERNSPLWYLSLVCMSWVRHELLEDGCLLAGFSASLLLSLRTAVLLAGTG